MKNDGTNPRREEREMSLLQHSRDQVGRVAKLGWVIWCIALHREFVPSRNDIRREIAHKADVGVGERMILHETVKVWAWEDDNVMTGGVEVRHKCVL